MYPSSCIVLLAYHPSSGVPIESLLRPDGTLDLSTGFNGNVDLSGFRMDMDEMACRALCPLLAVNQTRLSLLPRIC